MSCLEFNCKKCVCTAIGPASKYTIENMRLSNSSVGWSPSFKYLGVTFNCGVNMTVDTDIIKRKFYASCNCILGNASFLTELVKLQLLESYCLPVLLYATTAYDLSLNQLNDLNVGWNSVYRRIFGFNK